MSLTCAKDDHMEERELQFWMCEYPVHTNKNYINYREAKVLNKNPASFSIPNILYVLLPPYTLDSSALTRFQHTET